MSQPRSVFDYPLDGPALIEASAGTGKTWTISGLVVRLVVETGLGIDRILIVTFTEAAAEELRDRIRKRLVQALDGLEGRGFDSGDAFLVEALERWRDAPGAADRLQAALRGFDEAAVFTIHGFCQRALAERAFASGMPFETTLLENEGELIQSALDDYWRSRVLTLDGGTLDTVLKVFPSPDSLLSAVRPMLGKPYVACRGGEQWPDLAAARAEAEKTFDAFRRLWADVEGDLPDLLAQWPGKKPTSYKSNHVAGWLARIGAFVEAGDPLEPPKELERLTRVEMEKASRAEHQLPDHRIFDLAEDLVGLKSRMQSLEEAAILALQRSAVDWLSAELAQRKSDQRVQSFDDLLTNLDEALQGPLRDTLIRSVRDQYGAALIDEFQDTDPVQYRIFDNLFMGEPALPLFLVGDPKQAIYGFRGADIFAYLGAREEIGRHFTLQHNWRSDPGLIEAVNQVFSVDDHPRPFVFDPIPFQPALAPEKERKPLVDQRGGDEPFHLWPIPGDHSGKKPRAQSKTTARSQLTRAVTAEISRLLNDARQGRVTLGERALAPGDIAVLVFTNEQATEMQAALREAGVAAVLHSRESVFLAPEAGEIERLMLAFLEPHSPQRVRSALVTELWGMTADEVLSLAEDDTALARVQTRLQQYHDLWQGRGFMPAFNRFLFDQAVASRVLAAPAGDRQLTNLLHIAELLHREAARRKGTMESLVGWLAEQRRQSEEGSEAAQLRLESDSDRVQVVTMHKSKGLEYPVVFCPFLWNDVRTVRPGEPFVYHDRGNDNRACADFGHPERETHTQWQQQEALAELVRLAYVAVTRARNRCYLAWGWVTGFTASALGWLFHGAGADPERPLEALKDVLKDMDDSALEARLKALAAAHPGRFRVTPLPDEPEPLAPDIRPLENLAASEITRRIERPWRISSFSGLSHGQASEQPDRDAVSVPAAVEDVEPEGIFAFPRGARAGTCLHAVFEEIDFTDRSTWPAVVEAQLQRHGFEPDEWQDTVMDMLGEVTATELEAGIRLEDIGTGQRLIELGFHFPVRRLRQDRLATVLADHGFGELADGLAFDNLDGYMKGFIDLVFEQGGRFYIADYKSNYLGARLEDYDSTSLRPAMMTARYPLQYLIYTLALHRYLKGRLADYDYERDFGGVFYLFLRGMRAERGAATGVWRDRPPVELVEALDALMGGAGDE